MNQQKNINSLLSIVFLIIIVVCGIIISGIYMNDRWKKMRDVRRVSDLKAIIKAVDIYYLNKGELPNNISDQEWDSSYDPENNNQTFLKELQEDGIISYIFDPKNNEEYQYRYHKFMSGEYGCDRAFAIFQVTKFESEYNDIGKGKCPDKNFTLEASKGFTYQWFE